MIIFASCVARDHIGYIPDPVSVCIISIVVAPVVADGRVEGIPPARILCVYAVSNQFVSIYESPSTGFNKENAILGVAADVIMDYCGLT